MTCVDHLTKFVEAVPLAEVTAEAAARAFSTNIVARYGVIDTVITDQGRAFTSAFFNETCRILGVKHMTTSAWHASSNGIAERLNRTMNQALSFYVNAAGNDWDRLLCFYVMSYNSVPHGVTGFSPYYMLYGKEMCLPTSDTIRARLAPEVENTDQAARLENLKTTLQLAYQAAGVNIRKSHTVNQKYYNRKSKQRDFAIGDIVYLYNPARKKGQSKKFFSPWRGAYRVTGKKGELNYKILSQQGKEMWVHINRLKKANNPDIWEQKTPKTRVVRSARESEEEELEVEGEELIVARGPRRMQVAEEAEQILQHESPDRDLLHILDTPESASPARAAPIDPNYVQPGTPRSRQRSHPIRDQPPVTRARARRLALLDSNQGPESQE
jgi:transposase InsO family protein